jgi:uncharacterized protein
VPNQHRARLVLSVVETDTTFQQTTARGAPVWVGRCIFCQAKLAVPLDGEAERNVTVEHVVPRTHGGTDAPENLALACAGCNGEKGRRHDNRDRNDPRRIEVTRALLERRKERWPASARPPRWPEVVAGEAGERAAHAGAGAGAGPDESGDGERAPAALTVSALHIYPVKSAAGLSVREAPVGDRGLDGDRRFMVVTPDGRFASQRTLPRMALIAPRLDGGALELSAPGAPPLRVPFPSANDPSVQRALVEIWGDACEALDAGDLAATWLSGVLGQPLRLVYMPGESSRLVDPAYARRGELVSFADGFPLLLLTEASLADLNARLDAPVEMARFRPNIVIAGAAAFDEDRWQSVRIGGLTLRLVKPCSRCALVNVTQATGEAGLEPLRTLATYRKQRNQVMFGQNVLADGRGVLRVGDVVTVTLAPSP